MNRGLYEQKGELSRSNHELTQPINMLRALETIYLSLFYVNLEMDICESIYVALRLKAEIPEKGSYDCLKRMFIDNMIVPEFREEVDSRMSREFIRKNQSRDKLPLGALVPPSLWSLRLKRRNGKRRIFLPPLRPAALT